VRLVVDTNVLLSGSLWRGNPARLMDALFEGSATLCVSGPLLAEFEEVLQREKFQKRLDLGGLKARDLVSRLRAAAIIVDEPSLSVPSTLRDRDDLHVLACAVGAAADAIVTGDNDLLSMGAFEGIPILTAQQALEKLGIPPA